VSPRFTSRELLEAADRLDAHMVEQALIPVGDHLRLLAAPADEVRTLDPGADVVRKIIGFLRQLASAIVIETSYNLTESYYAGLAAVDQVLVISRHTPEALQDLKLVCQSLRRDHGIRTVYPVINRFDPRDQNLTVAQMREALGEPQLLTVAADRALQNQSITGLKVLEPTTFAGPALQDIQAIAYLVLGTPPPQRSENAGLFDWLKGVFGGG
jgi:Flp pilus assembly CpaE family ATPase